MVTPQSGVQRSNPHMETTLFNVLPNLGVGVAAVGAMYGMYRLTLVRLKEKDEEFLTEIKEREEAFREYSKDVQQKTMQQLGENTRALERVIKHLDSHH